MYMYEIQTDTVHTCTYNNFIHTLHKSHSQSHTAYNVLMYLSECPSNQTLYDSSAVLVKQMNLINDEKTHNLSQLYVPCRLPRDHVPLLRCRHNHLG